MKKIPLPVAIGIAAVLILAFSLAEGAYIDSFFTAFIASIILAFVNSAVEGLFKD